MKATKPQYEAQLVSNISKTMDRVKHVCQPSSIQPNHGSSLGSYNVLGQSRNSTRFTDPEGSLPSLIYNEFHKMTRKFITVFTYLHTYSLTYLLTPWSRVLLEKLTGFQLVKKFSVFYGTRRFITAFTIACHLSLSSASPIQFIPPHPNS
jgi:hypothetical protein